MTNSNSQNKYIVVSMYLDGCVINYHFHHNKDKMCDKKWYVWLIGKES